MTNPEPAVSSWSYRDCPAEHDKADDMKDAVAGVVDKAKNTPSLDARGLPYDRGATPPGRIQ